MVSLAAGTPAACLGIPGLSSTLFCSLPENLCLESTFANAMHDAFTSRRKFSGPKIFWHIPPHPTLQSRNSASWLRGQEEVLDVLGLLR